MYPTVIDGRTFIICTERDIDDGSSNDSWRAWCFFAFDLLAASSEGAVTLENKLLSSVGKRKEREKS